MRRPAGASSILPWNTVMLKLMSKVSIDYQFCWVPWEHSLSLVAECEYKEYNRMENTSRNALALNSQNSQPNMMNKGGNRNRNPRV
jgi:hypothetical protein